MLRGVKVNRSFHIWHQHVSWWIQVTGTSWVYTCHLHTCVSSGHLFSDRTSPLYIQMDTCIPETNRCRFIINQNRESHATEKQAILIIVCSISTIWHFNVSEMLFSFLNLELCQLLSVSRWYAYKSRQTGARWTGECGLDHLRMWSEPSDLKCVLNASCTRSCPLVIG